MSSLPAVVRSLLGFDDPPLTIGAAYARLVAICKRDHPSSYSVMTTMDGVYAYFGAEHELSALSISVTVTVRRHEERFTSAIVVAFNGRATAHDLDEAEAIAEDALRFSQCCRRHLREWGML